MCPTILVFLLCSILPLLYTTLLWSSIPQKYYAVLPWMNTCFLKSLERSIIWWFSSYLCQKKSQRIKRLGKHCVICFQISSRLGQGQRHQQELLGGWSLRQWEWSYLPHHLGQGNWRNRRRPESSASLQGKFWRMMLGALMMVWTEIHSSPRVQTMIHLMICLNSLVVFSRAC